MSEPGEFGLRESPLGNTYFYRLRATTSRWRWWVSVIDRQRDLRFDVAFGEFGGWHVLGLKRAHRKAQRFIEKRMRRDARQAALSAGTESSDGRK